MASIRDPVGREWRDKGHAWDRGHAHRVLAACGAPAHHYEHAPTGHVQIRVPPGVDPDRLIERLRRHPHVACAEFDGIGKTAATVANYPPDPNLDPPVDRGIRRIDLLGALRYGLGDPAVRIAVVDTGLRPHEDLYIAPENSWSCLDGVVTQNDAYITTTSGGAPHGLLTTGCVGALANGKGIIGTGAGCTIIAIRVADAAGNMPYSNMIAGFYQAAAVDAHIVSLSILAPWTSAFGGEAGPTALSYLASQGIVVLCAAGNGGSTEPVMWHSGSPPTGHSYNITRDLTVYGQPFEIISPTWTDYWPPSHADSFVVAAMGLYEWDKSVGPLGWCWSGDMRSIWHVASLGGTAGGTLNPSPFQGASTTGRGPRIGVVAPDGINILQGSWNAGEWVPSTSYSRGGDGGTSFSTPIAAGAFGLAKSENFALTREQLRDIVQQSADDPLYPDGNTPPYLQSGAAPFFHGAAIYPPKPWSSYFPNAGVLNVARARLKAWTTNPANAGLVRAYLHVIDDPNNPAAVTYNGPTTTIDGPCFLDVDGYSSDPVTSVELWIGGLRLYSGSARRFYAAGSTSGPAQRLRVVAKTASAVADDARSDIVVASLTCPDFDPVGIASVTLTAPQTYLVTGKMHAGTTVTLDGSGGTVGGIVYTDGTSWQATVSDVPSDATSFTATASDGVVATASIDGMVAAVAGLSGYAPAMRGTTVPARAALSVNGFPAGLVGVVSPTGGLLGLLGYTPDLHAYVAIFAPAADVGLDGFISGIAGLAQPPASLAPLGIAPIVRGYVVSPAAVADLLGYPPSVGFAIDSPAARAGLDSFPPALLGALLSPAALAGLAETRPAHVWPSNFAVTEGGLLIYRGGSWVGLELRRFDGAQWVPVST